MSEGWVQTTVEGACELIADCPHSTPEWTNSGVLVLRNTYIKDGRFDFSSPSFTNEETYHERIRRAVPSAGDLVISREAPMGEIAMIPSGIKACLGQRLVLLRTNPRVCDSRFLLYSFLRGPLRHQVMQHDGTGSTVSNLRIPDLKALKVRLPPLETQRAIASILGALDDKIELNRRMNRTLEATARALFKSWFVDFDPVHANAEGRVLEGLSADVQALFPSSFENGVPSGWEVSTIGEETQVQGGSTPSTKSDEFWIDGEYSWATPKDLSNVSDPILINTERKVTRAGLESISSALLPVGTVLLSSRAPIGYLAITEIPVAINQGFIAMRCEQFLSNYYIYFWSQQNMDEIKSRGNGSTFMEISKSNFRPMQIVKPNEVELAEFNRIIKPLFEKIKNNSLQSRALEDQRNSLLPQLLSGEIAISMIEEVVS